MHFSWPWVFLLLPLPMVFRAAGGTRSKSVRIPPALASALTQTQQARTSFKYRLLWLWCTWCLLLLTLSQPWIPGDTSVQPVSGRAMTLAVDVSASMERRDFVLDGQVSDRLSVLKQVARDFVLARTGDRVGLVIYGKEAFIASPLTFDLKAVSEMLNSAGIGMAGRSTAIGDAIGLAIQTLRDDPADNKAIVLLSDGTNNAGSVEPESAAELAANHDIRIHTIAMGSEDSETGGYNTAQSADLDEDTLRSIADVTGGEFFRARTRDDLQAVYNAIDRLETADVDAPPVILRQELHVWPQIMLLGMLIVMAFAQRARP